MKFLRLFLCLVTFTLTACMSHLFIDTSTRLQVENTAVRRSDGDAASGLGRFVHRPQDYGGILELLDLFDGERSGDAEVDEVARFPDAVQSDLGLLPAPELEGGSTAGVESRVRAVGPEYRINVIGQGDGFHQVHALVIGIAVDGIVPPTLFGRKVHPGIVGIACIVSGGVVMVDQHSRSSDETVPAFS